MSLDLGRTAAKALALALGLAGCGARPSPSEPAVTEVTLPSTPAREAPVDAASSTPRHALAAPGPSQAPTSEGAPGDRALARALFMQAVEAQAKGDLPRALTLFKRAYALVPNHKVLERIAVTELALGDRASACVHLEQLWLESDPSEHPRLLGQFGTTCPQLAQLP